MSERRPVLIRQSDGFEVALGDDERTLLGSLPRQLAGVLASLSDLEMPLPEELRRLFPVAYATDEESEAVYERDNRAALAEHHRQALDVLAATSSATHITDAQAEEWLAALNVLRLAFGAALGVSEEATEPVEDDPTYAEWLCYHYLTYLESEVVDAIAPLLPEPGPGADDTIPDDPWGDPPGGLRWDGTPVPDND